MRRRNPTRVAAGLAIAALLLAACGGDDGDGEAAETTETETEAEPEPEPEDDGGDEGDDDGGEAAATAFPEREIRFITRGSAGGGHDTFTRGMAPLLEEELGVTVVVENMTGGAGVVAAEYMRESAEPDGYTVHIMDPVGLIGNYVAQDADFDFDEDFDWTWLGTVTQRSSVFTVGPDSEYDTWDKFVAGMEAGGLRWAHTGLGSTHAYNGILVLNELGLPFPTFVPHEGSADVFTSLARGDGDFTVLAIDSVLDAINNGDAQAILQFSGPNVDLLPDVPRGGDVGLENFDGLLQSSLAMVVPPDTPEDVVAVLRDAYESVIFSEELAQWGEENERLVDPLDSAATEEQLRGVTEFYKENRDVITSMLEGE